MSYLNNQEYYNLIKESSFYQKFGDDNFSQNWYAAFCNNEFVLDGRDKFYFVSWRGAAADVAAIRKSLGISGDYMDWFCSGAAASAFGYVQEGTITPEVQTYLKEIGFVLVDK